MPNSWKKDKKGAHGKHPCYFLIHALFLPRVRKKVFINARGWCQFTLFHHHTDHHNNESV